MSLLIIVSAAHAARIKLPTEETYFYWMNYTDADGKGHITSPIKVQGPKGKVEYSVLGVKPKNVILTALETETGNVAVRPLKPEDGELPTSIALKESDFDCVRNVSIRVTDKNGRPVESALVVLTDAANNTTSQVIEPTSGGRANFQDIAGGVVTVKVTCAGRKSLNDVEIPLERDSASFSTEIPIPGDVPILKPQAASSKTGKEVDAGAGKSAVPPHPNPTGILVQTLVGALFLGLLAYVGLTLARSRGITLAGALRKAGVQLPGEAEPARMPSTSAAEPQAQADPSICQFCGQRKDAASSACACTVNPAAARGAIASGPSLSLPKGPRLVGVAGPYVGRVFDLAADVATIGREESNAVALVDDATASRRHARITHQNDQFVIQDEGSANGTLVNGVRIMDDKSLSPGDEVQIGSSRFRFEA